jgi:uncharacterized protein (UPF0332 family)
MVKARESLKAARLLLDGGFGDFAASRAYFAMFYAAEALLAAKGLEFSSHSAVIGAFGREYAKPGLLDPKLHRHLIAMQEARLNGDYEDIGVTTAHVAGHLLEQAEGFVQAADEFLKKSDAST